MKRGCGVAAAWGVVLSSLPAFAMKVEVSASPPISGCLTREELESGVTAAFGAAELPSDDYTLRVGIAPVGRGGIRARVEWASTDEGGPGREIETAGLDCRQLDDALPLIARALWDDEAARSQETSARPLRAMPPSAAALHPYGPVARDHVPDRPRRNTLDLGVAAVGSWGIVNDPVLAARAEARTSLGASWALRLAGTYLSEPEPTEVDGAQVQFNAATGRALGCWVPRFPFSLDACLGVDAGVLMPERTWLRGGKEGNRLLLWPVALLAVRQPILGPLMAQLTFAAGPALTRQDFYMKDVRGEPHQVRTGAPALVEVGLGMGLALP